MTAFGRAWTRAHVDFTYDECGDAAIEALYRARSVTIAAPDYGPDQRVWRMLDEWAAQHTHAPLE